MRRYLFPALLGAALAASASTGRAQSPADYFELGKFMNQTNYPEIWNNFPRGSEPQVLRRGRALLLACRPPADLLASYDQFAAQIGTLPLDQPFTTWRKDQQDTWYNANLDFKLRDRWLGRPNNPAFFYFWLGFEGDYCGEANLNQVLDWGTGANRVRGSVIEAVDHFVQLAHSPLLRTLAQDPMEDVQSIAALKPQLQTSGNGLDDIRMKTLQQKGADILSARDNEKAGSTGALFK